MKNFIKIGGLFLGLAISLNSLGQLTSTNLPIVMLTTTQPVTTTQTQASMAIVNNGSGVNTPTDAPQFAGMIGIELRGSATSPKKSYSIETWSTPTVSTNVSLLGMPSENDWVLIAAYADRSLVRNSLTYLLHEKMGKYAPRMKLCEVLLDNQYQGVYLFGEKIKRDSLRLDLANLTNIDNSGENLTGGYIFKLDNGGGSGWTSMIAPPYATTQQIEFQYEYPSNNDLIPVQKDYIKSYVDSFEVALNAPNFQDTTLGWRRFGAIGSFIDYMIMQEVSKNEEAYRINSFMYKDKGKKLRVGPMWNAEVSWANTMDCKGNVDTGFCYNLGAYCGTENRLVPFWYAKLASDTSFYRNLTCTYTYYRKPGNVLDTNKIFYLIDSMVTYMNQSAITPINRNFAQWPIFNVPIQNEPTPMAADHTTEIANMKKFIKARLAWLDAKWAPSGGCIDPLNVSTIAFGEDIQIYPNPTTSAIQVNMPGQKGKATQLDLYSIQGTKLSSMKVDKTNAVIDLSNIPSGIYLLQIKSANGTAVKKIVKQ